MTAADPHPLEATVVIATKNRKDDLRIAIQSCLNQTARIEVIVIDDGSTDDTSAMVASEFPTVRLVREDASAGYIVRRNQAAALTQSPFIFSLDDDAAYVSPNTIRQTLDEFTDSRIAAVAIPYIDINKSPQILAAPSNPSSVFVVYFYVGTAHAIRRDVFLQLGGYRASLVHQGEEVDLGIRLLDAGYVVRVGGADPIHHFESPRRDFRRVDYYERRNNILYAWHNVPLRYLAPHLLGTTYLGIRKGLRTRRLWQMTRGIVAGWFAIPGEFSRRRPVRSATYRMVRRLMRERSLPMEDVVSGLPEAFANSASRFNPPR